jgi:hypothetical protein
MKRTRRSRLRPTPRPSRRDAIKMGVLATVGATVACARTAPPKPANPGGFLTADELALLDELSETIIPTDAHSPGAKAAKVAAFIDARLGEAFEEADRTRWRDGLARVDRLAKEIASKTFVQASPDQRTAVVARMAKNEGNPTTADEIFFAELKERVAHAYYSSEVGLKQELEYQGNVFLAEFVGTDVS